LIVLDASAALEWLLQTPTGVRIEQRLLQPRETIHAPHLLDLEIAQALRKSVAAGWVAHTEAEEALADLADTKLTRYPHYLFLPRVWELRGNLTAYDAIYVALAEELSSPLITCDEKLRRSAGHGARIEKI